MGADRGPQVPIEGALAFLQDHRREDVAIVLVGDETEIRRVLHKQVRFSKETRFEVQHAPEIVEMNATQTEGIRRKNSSIAVAMPRSRRVERAGAASS
jgi:glycerol-3-phosphate acyltransferase PlsX